MSPDSWETFPRVVNEFAALFFGNLNGYGTEEGLCVRPEQPTIDEYEKRIERHLKGDEPMGVYPMVLRDDGWMVQWGCIDWDEGEQASLAYARNTQLALSQFSITSFVERSRSKGYHLWVFPVTWVPTVVMREALLAACQLVGAPTKEINPKSISLNENQLGNYVRLPYPNGLVEPTPQRRVVIDPQDRLYGLSQFIDAATSTRCTSEALQGLRELYVAPKKKIPPIIAPGPTSSTPASQRLQGLAFTIWRDGPLPGGDRSGALWKLINLIREQGDITYSEAVELCQDADFRWGKHTSRGEPEKVAEQVTKGWGA